MPKQKSCLVYTMERMAFAMGAPRRETKQQKRERLRKEREWKDKQNRKKGKRSFEPFPKEPSWLVLPHHVCKGFEFWILTLHGKSFLQKRKALLEQIAKAQEPVKPAMGFDTTFAEAMRQDVLSKAQIVMSLLHQNQELRWKFKNFLTKVRIRRFQEVNTVDPITLEPFKQPVKYHSFSQRKTYTYEAESFAKHMHRKLTNNDGHIALPMNPKNPFTNEEFTLSQTMGLLHQCRKVGHTTWALEAFLETRYDVTTFALIHSKPLRLNALHSVMADEKSWDAIDTLYDFIKTEHLYHKKTFPKQIYLWALHHAPHEKRMQTWKKLCIKYYETDILVDDSDTKESLFTVVSAKTLPLCAIPHELQILRKLAMKSPESSDGSSSSRDTESEG